MKTITFLMILAFCFSGIAQSAEIKFTIPDEKLPTIVSAYETMYPIPLDEDGDPEFTPAQWAKEMIRRYIRQTVYNYQRKLAVENIDVLYDDDIAQ